MDLVSSIAAFGYTVVIGIVLLIVWENIRRKQYGIFYEIRTSMAAHWCVCTWVDWIGDIG